MDSGVLGRWLDAYGRAWETKDPEAAADLFAEDATYHETPFDEPMRGRAEISGYWSDVPTRSTSPTRSSRRRRGKASPTGTRIS